jgi:hypothetical protein
MHYYKYLISDLSAPLMAKYKCYNLAGIDGPFQLLHLNIQNSSDYIYQKGLGV